MNIYSTSTKCLILYLSCWNNFDNQPLEWGLWFTVADLQACVPEAVGFRRHILRRRIEVFIMPLAPAVPFLPNTSLLPHLNAIYAAVNTFTESTREPLLDWSSMSTGSGSISNSGAKSCVFLSTLTP